MSNNPRYRDTITRKEVNEPLSLNPHESKGEQVEIYVLRASLAVHVYVKTLRCHPFPSAPYYLPSVINDKCTLQCVCPYV